MEDCIFCKIVNGEIPSYKIWENDEFIAFLSIIPNTEGFTVVASKMHKPSYIFENDTTTINGVMSAAKEVAKVIDSKYEDVGRTGVIFEGFGVDHLHAKLFPMHGTKDKSWRKRVKLIDKYFENYEGYISTHDYKQQSDEELKRIAKKLRE